MSFFFDVWAHEGFVLASDVRLLVSGVPSYAHKIGRCSSNSKIISAIAVCGEYPEACISWFIEASNSKDFSLKDIAKYFAEKWTDRFGGTEEYSAVHLVGFEPIVGTPQKVPQMWFWHNWEEGSFYSKEKLLTDLASFSDPIPLNNHIPWTIKRLTGKFPGPMLEAERNLVMSFLQLYQPFFTWNGDTQFWRSAGETVASAMNLLWRHKSMWSINETQKLTRYCLTFLGNVASLMPNSSVGLLDDKDFDVVKVTEGGVEVIAWPDLCGQSLT